MVAYIDGHKDEFGVEPICTTLQVAPSTYYAAKARLPSAMALRDAVLGPLLLALWVRQLPGVRRAQDVEGAAPLRRDRRAGPGGPFDAPAGHPGRAQGHHRAHHPSRRQGRPPPGSG